MKFEDIDQEELQYYLDCVHDHGTKYQNPEPITRLDLGGTACYEKEDAVSISLDGSTCDDYVVPNIIGDYNRMPFRSDAFDEALGSCYLENIVDFVELARVMKPGGRVIVKSCGYIKGTKRAAKAAGFKIIEHAAYLPGYGYDSSMILVKEQ